MEILRTASSVRGFVESRRSAGETIGFVPTMGAFHEGHLTLMRRAKGECGRCVVSLFVNPTQFRPGEDFDRYPRDLETDSGLAESAGVDALFVPSVEEIYPDGPAVTVRVDELGDRWEGARRPGHFDGVATVCAKLFNIVPADRAYFGQKDFQQLKVIQRLVAALHVPTEIVTVPTVRESDGLAMSSRNTYLNDDERLAAPVIKRALQAAKARFHSGERSSEEIIQAAREVLADEDIVSEDYLDIADSESLEPLTLIERRAVILVAARVGPTRLLDNVLLECDGR